MPKKVDLPKGIRAPRPVSGLSPAAIGHRILRLRQALHWSNKEFSVRTGIPAPQLSQYVHGRKGRISGVDAWRIAKTCGVTTDYIIYGSTAGLSPEWIRRIASGN